jgi:hypothetical protein
VACGKLVRYSRHLTSHVEPLLLELGPPWSPALTSQPQASFTVFQLLFFFFHLWREIIDERQLNQHYFIVYTLVI